MGSGFQIHSTMESGFSSPRHDGFPAGLRVLVVDDDPTWLKILEKMLKKCSYEVTTCGLARDALNLLRERKDGYDIVISDVNMPDMDGFKLLELVGLEMDLPVIMMSVDGETSRVMKGVQHGACDYLLKPIRMKELRNIWQHVLRKRIHEGKDVDSHEIFDGFQMNPSGLDWSNDHFFCGEETSSVKKRKEAESKHDDRDFADPGSSSKKSRVIWSVDLHQKFVRAVNQIGFEKVGPKKILDLMNVSWLTRENVASHLQKYRLYLTRLQKENGSKACFSGAKHSETANPSVNFSMQASIMPQEEIPNKNFTVSGNKLPVQNANPIDNGDDLKSTVLVPREESKQSLIDEVPNLQESSRGIETGFKPSFMPFLHEERYAEFNSNTPAHYSWRGVPEAALKEESDAHIRVEDSGCLLKSTNSRPRLAEDQGIDLKEYKPLYADCRRKNIVGQNPLTMQSNNAITQEKDNLAYCQDFQTIHTSPPKIQGRDIDSSGPHFPYTAHEKVSSVSGSTFGPSDENLQVAWLENCQFSTNIRIQNSDFIGYSDQCFVSEVPINSYETLRYDYEPFMDPSECSIADHGLFIT